MENRIGMPSAPSYILARTWNTWLVLTNNSHNTALLEQDKDIIDSMVQGVLQSLQGLV